MIDENPKMGDYSPARAAAPAVSAESATSAQRRAIDCTPGADDHGGATRRRTRGGSHRERDVIGDRPPRTSGDY